MRRRYVKRMTLRRLLCAAGLSVALAGGLAGCADVSGGYGDLPEGAAATVDGAVVSEEAVTQRVEDLRSGMGLEDAGAWGSWLAENGYTPALIRDQVIGELVQEVVAVRGAKDAGFVVTEDEANSFIEYERGLFEDEQAWIEYVESLGCTEGTYREYARDELARFYHQQSFVETATVSDEQMLEYGRMMSASYDGAKKSSHILFAADDKATAQGVLEEILSGELSFEEAASSYSIDAGTAANGGNVGWSVDGAFDEEYLAALDDLEEGELSGLVETAEGIHIIKCTAHYIEPDELSDVDQLPGEFVEMLTDLLKTSAAKEDYAEWVAGQVEASEVVKAEMPKGLPYDVDLAAYEAAAEGEGEPGEGASAEGQIQVAE